ncbi:MAG TPA: ATP-binding protein [Sphingomonas sp.]|nr:ATP-binding protein [Sphingomonas sp.]
MAQGSLLSALSGWWRGGRGEAAADDPRPGAPGGVGVLIEAIADPVLVLHEGRVVEANRAARALLGEASLGEDVRLAIRHPVALERLADGDGGDRAVEFVGLGGENRHWEMRASAEAGGYRLVHLVDRTARAAAERMRVDFVANASHELKTPLASLAGYVETLREAGAGDDPGLRARFLGIMAGEAGRMQRLIEDLLSLSRIEAEKYRLPDAAVDLGALVREVIAQIAASGDPRAEDIALALADAPAVAGDRAQLSQLLHNLVGNAMKYAPAGTPVAVSVAPAARDMVELSVRDGGEGVATEHLPRLTERFYRVDAGRSRGLGGTGLGLAIVKHIVERHRGRLDLASAPGAGLTVTVLLPARAVIKG